MSLVETETTNHENNVESTDRHNQKCYQVEAVMNDEQFEAVTKPIDSRIQVISGPGTGKNSWLNDLVQ